MVCAYNMENSFTGDSMKRNRMQNKLTQFSYDHEKLNRHVSRIQRSADEVSRLLNNMTPKKEEKKEN